MNGIKLTGETIRCIPIFENITKARAKDCIDCEDKLIFIVESGQLGLAIGKGGANIRILKDLLKKNIDIIEYAPEIDKFIRNIFHNYKILEIAEDKNRKKVIRVTVAAVDKGKVIGRSGKNIELVRNIVKRYHDIEDVVIA